MKGAIVFTTTGRAAEYQGTFFGIYVPIPLSPEEFGPNAVAYQQKNNLPESKNLPKYIFREDKTSGTWFVGHSVGNTRSAVLRHPTDLPSIPRGSWDICGNSISKAPMVWDYYSQEDGSWYHDFELEVVNLSEMPPNSICEKVKIFSKKVYLTITISYSKNLLQKH